MVPPELLDSARRELEERRNALLQRFSDSLEAENELLEGRHAEREEVSVDQQIAQMVNRLGEREVEQISELLAALRRLDEGTYGYCEMCEEPISEGRLRAIPETRYCLECAEDIQEGFVL